jgi:hypothetical protein
VAPGRPRSALIGPSGCGKSTPLGSLNRMYALYPGQRAEGEIIMDGANILSQRIDLARLRSRSGMAFQRPTPPPSERDGQNCSTQSFAVCCGAVTYAVIYGPSNCQREAIVFSLGEAARFAVRYMKEGRPDVRVRLPGGDTLGFEDFQQAVFAGRLTDKGAPPQPRTEPAISKPAQVQVRWHYPVDARGASRADLPNV